MHAAGRTGFLLVWVFASLLLLAGQSSDTRAQTSPRDASIFQKLLTTVDYLDPVVSDYSGIIEPATDRVSFDPINGSTAHFGLRVTFRPASDSPGDWDFGIAFRVGANGEHFRFVVDSDGRWNQSLGSSSPRLSGEGLDIATQDDRSTQLDLFAVESIGYVGIDGLLVATLDLTDIVSHGGLAAGSGFAPDTAPDAVAVSYEDLTVWSFDDSAPPTGEIARELITQDSDPSRALQLVVDAAGRTDPAFGPDEGALPHSEERATIELALVNLEDAAIHVECLSPNAQSDVRYDCGILFRVRDEDELLRLVVVSDRSWWLLDGSSTVLDNGTVPVDELDERVEIDAVIAGSSGMFAVNDAFVDVFDVTEEPESGDIAVGTGFFADTFAPGSATPFENFAVWAIAGTASPDSPEAQPVSAVELDTELTNGRYQSSRYDFEITWPEGWFMVDAESSLGVDHVALTNGTVEADVFGFGGNESAIECVEFRIDTLARDDALDEVIVLAAPAPSEDRSSSLIQTESTGSDGNTHIHWTDISCVRLWDSVLVRIEQSTPALAFAKSIPGQLYPELDLLAASQSGSAQDVVGSPPPATPGPSSGDSDAADPFANVETTESAREAAFSLAGDGVEGFGVITRVQRTVDIVAVVVGASLGDLLVIRAGSCGIGGAGSDGPIRVDSFDGRGLANDTLDMRLTEIVNVRQYVAEIYDQDDSGLNNPLACGAIEVR